MKKVLSMVLAMATVASLASVAFAGVAVNANMVEFSDGTGDPFDSVTAANPTYNMVGTGVNNTYKIWMADSNDDGKLKPYDGSDILKGESFFIPLAYDTANMKHSDVKKWKIKADWLVGEDQLEMKPEIAYKKTTTGSYQYFVEFTTKQVFNTGTKDVLGFISVYKGSSKVEGTKRHAVLEFGKVGTNAIYIGAADAKYPNFDPLIVKNNTAPYAFKFKPTGGDYITDQADTEVITFEGVGEFEGNYWEQGSLFLGFNTDWIPEIADVYEDAELEFTTFPGSPMFNKWGTFRMYDPDETGDKFIYTLVDGKLEAVETKYDDEYEAYVFGAKQLGTFIMSDKELDVNVYNNRVVEDEDAATEGEVPTEDVKPIPDTGR